MPSNLLDKSPDGTKRESHRHTLSRLSPGHSGLDYVESVREVSFFQGKFVRLLFTGQLKTRNPLYLTLFLFGALLFPLGLLLGLFTIQQPGPSAFWTSQFWLPLIFGSLPMIALGLACLITFSNSIDDIRRSRGRKHKSKH